MTSETDIGRHDNYPPGWPTSTVDCSFNPLLGNNHYTMRVDSNWLQHVDDPDYLWDEKTIIQEMKQYIDSTYRSHYGQDKLQATQVIDDAGHGLGFMVGNIIKYAKRYGKKSGYNKRDLQKIIHYAVMMIHIHERDNYDEHPKEG
jgi:hypothetical protein